MIHLLAELDKAGAEWVVVAYLTMDGNMLDVVESGKGAHTVTGSLISGAPEDFVDRENKLVGNNTDPTTIAELREPLLPEIDSEWYMPRIMSIRQAGKKSNHGLNYDMRYKTFALHNEMPEGEARILVNLYHQAYPGIRQWHSAIQTQLRKDRILENCFGRKRRFLDSWGPELFDAAYSFLPQSTVFDITREGMVKTYADKRYHGTIEQLAQVHDSILTGVHSNSYTDIAAALITVGLDHMNPTLLYNGREFKIGTTLKVGLDWGNMEDCLLTEDVDAVAQSIQEAVDKIHAKAEA